MYVVDYDPFFFETLAGVFVQYGYDETTAEDRADLVMAYCETYSEFPHRMRGYDHILPGLKCTWCERNGRVLVYLAAVVDDAAKLVLFIAAGATSLGRDELVVKVRSNR
ncbi:MAG: hypothetical protein WA956_13340 [Stenotrophomonas sp.]